MLKFRAKNEMEVQTYFVTFELKRSFAADNFNILAGEYIYFYHEDIRTISL